MTLRCVAFVVLFGGMAVAAGTRQLSAQVVPPTADQMTLSTIEVQRLVKLLQLQPGTNIADVGAGLGAWALRFAQWTGPKGHVYATDIEDLQLTSLRALFVKERLTNVTVLAGAADSTNLPAACCDAILMRNVFHYVTEPAAMIRSLAASLKPGGRLAIVDFPPRPNSVVPPGVPANRGGNGIPPEIVEREIGVLLRHVTTVPDWAPEGTPKDFPVSIGRPYVAIFEKAK